MAVAVNRDTTGGTDMLLASVLLTCVVQMRRSQVEIVFH